MDGFFLAFARFIAVLVWAAVGLLVWPFMLIRSIVGFVVVSILAPFSASIDFNKAVQSMRIASGFYFHGFLQILDTGATPRPSTDDDGGILWAAVKFVSELYGSVIVFWLPLAMMTGFAPLNSFINLVLWPFLFIIRVVVGADLSLPWS